MNLDRSRIGARGLVVCALALSVASPTAAQPKADKQGPDKAALDEAKDRFKRGLALYKEGSLDAALVEFTRAYELSANWKILYNMAAVHRDQRNYVEALKAFERFVEAGGKQVETPKRKEVEGEIEQLRKFVGKLSITVSVAGAEVRIDDQLVGKSPLPDALAVNAGKRRVSVTLEGRQPASEVVTVASGDTAKLTVTLVEPRRDEVPAAAPPPSPAPPPPPPPPPPPSKFTTLSWVGLGTAGAFAVGAGVAGVFALQASKKLDETQFVGPTPGPDMDSQQTKVKTLRTTSDVLAGAAVVTVGVTLALTLSREPKPTETGSGSLRIGASPGSAWLAGTFL